MAEVMWPVSLFSWVLSIFVVVVQNGSIFSLFLATVIYERDTGRSRGFGFVTFSDPRHVDLAIEKLTDTVNYYMS